MVQKGKIGLSARFRMDKELYKCEICKERFRYKLNFRNHQKKHKISTKNRA